MRSLPTLLRLRAMAPLAQVGADQCPVVAGIEEAGKDSTFAKGSGPSLVI
jgi:hypothetical protein